MSFSFVAYDGPKCPLDPSVRRLIRRQAMKDIAAERRQKGSYGKHNLGQCPIFLEGSNRTEDLLHPGKRLSKSVASYYKRDRVTNHAEQQSQNQHAVVSSHDRSSSPIPRSPQDYIIAERFSLLLHLTPLTELLLGISQLNQFALLKSKIGGSANILSAPHLGSHKLLSFIPSRYGHVPSLSYATDCVVAKLKQMMKSPDSRTVDGDAVVLVYYTKALRALQAALDDETQRTTAETLCATELLGVFELLNGSPEARSWRHHAGGAAQLIKARGAHRFQTDFEMALFTAHIGPTVMDAFLNNKSCFLAEEQWLQVMHLAISKDESLAEQQDLVLGLWGHLVDGPKKFKEVTDLVVSLIPPPQSVVDGLIEEILETRGHLQYWAGIAQNQPSLLSAELEICKQGTIFVRPTFHRGIGSSQHITQLALWGTYLLCRILKGRLLVALSPVRFHHLEAECQDLAGRIMGLRKALTKDESEQLLDHLLISQSIWIAKGIVGTEDIWHESREPGNSMIEKWKFEAWCKAIGRNLEANYSSLSRVH